MRIRTRLLLLVFAVWLPAAAGFGLLARETYEREAQAAQERVRRLAQSLNFLVERELDKRAVLARTLAASRAVREGDIARFHEDASAALNGSGDWAVLVDRTMQLANTLRPFDAARPIPRAPGVPMVTGEPAVHFTERGAVLKKPALALFAAGPGPTPSGYNVGVSFDPAVIQALLDQHEYPERSVAAVVGPDHRVMARSRDPLKWFGVPATPDVIERMKEGRTGFAASRTLDGVTALAYLTPPNRFGWSIVIGFPTAALAEAARRSTLNAVAASAALLLIGLGLAFYGGRRISAPIVALREAAAELGEDRIPPRLATGVSEADAVGAALHEAGLRSSEAKRTLELRVAQAVEQARQAQARLLEGQKREAIGRLTGGLAHDFNNLLQTISTGLQVIDRTTGDGPHRRVLDAATRATAKAADLVRQMLSFGRTQALQAQPVDLNDFVLRSKELTGKALGRRVSLTAAIAPGLPPLFVDPVQLELAILNLVFNARDALPEGGRVLISGRLATPDESAELEPGRHVCVEVADDGTGMDAETLGKAFDPYFTTKPVGSGSGLGLPQVLAFARQSGGDVRIRSTPGSGTRVCMVLPAASEPAPAAGEPAPPASRATRALKVLMAEDEVLVASVVVPALEGAGHAVRLCGSADEARSILATGEPFDVLFTDVVMPGGMTGVDLVGWCREHRPGLPAVVATGYMAQRTELPLHLLRKPYGMEALLAALQEAAAEHETQAGG